MSASNSINDGVEISKAKDFGAQSAFASTLLADTEKAYPSQTASQCVDHNNLYGTRIDTSVEESGADAVYAAKAKLLNEALLDIGMGMYQWLLFLITGMGWFLDYFWLVSFTIIAPSASNEAQFFYTYNKEAYLFISQFVGLTVGAFAWPAMADKMGRKRIFTSTLVLMGMGGLVGAGMPAFTGLCVVGFVIGLAVAGNQAVDAIVLLESIPASHQYLVAMQGVFSGLGQLVAYAVGWAFISDFTCGTGPDEVSTASTFSRRQHSSSTGSSSSSSSSSGSSSSSSCHYVSNKGWRYVWWTFGCITLFLYLCRFAFPLRETPKHVLSRRRDAEATQTVKDTAVFNKRQTWLTESSFARIDSAMDADIHETQRKSSTRAISSCLKPAGLVLLCFIWTVSGLTFPLHKTYLQNYLSARGVDAVNATNVSTDYLYSRYLYIALSAVPGPLVAGFLVEAKGLGRKRAGAAMAILTGLFMFLSTLSRSRGAWLGFECVLSLLQFAGLAIVTTYTVEVFDGPVRGTGVGITGGCWRFFGLVASIITALDGTGVAGGAAVWFCGAIWIVAAGAWLALPVETRARAAA